MLIAADTHVHLYPFYDRDAALDGAFARLAELAAAAHVRAICLTERFDCRAFRALPGTRVEEAAVRWGDSAVEQWVFAGRQIVTRERLEVLALTTDAAIEDGLPIDDVLQRVAAAGGVPVLAWAPGKWFFQRGAIVNRLMQHTEPGHFMLGDTSLRPVGWPEPGLMASGKRIGFRVVAGSDPLPFAGEEKRAGSYGITLDADWDSAKPVTSLRRALADGKLAFIGRRCGLFEVMERLNKNRMAKKNSA